MARFEGKTALVTGAASGIGRATALQLADEDGLVRDEALVSFFQARVAEALRDLSSHERVRGLLILGRPLRPDRGEVTATAKMRRANLLAGFAGQIDALYA